MSDGLTQPLIDRHEAGAITTQQLRHYANKSNVVILALPRGGMPVAYEVATVLGVSLDVSLAGAVGMPGEPELSEAEVDELVVARVKRRRQGNYE